MPKFNTIDEYINSQPKEHAKLLQDLREAILEAAPDAVETFNYGVPAFALVENGKRDQQIMIAGFKNHVGLYPHPSVIEKFEKELYVREAAALVGSIRDRIYRIAGEECAAAARRKGLSEAEAENLRTVTVATVNRIIRAHMSELKKLRGEGEAESEGLLEAVKKAFGGI